MVSYPNSINGNLSVSGNLTVTGGTINLGADVIIYRSAVNEWKTDDFFIMAIGGQSNAEFTAYTGNKKALIAGTVGGGIAIAEGANARMGTLVLNGATPVVVPNTSVTAITRVFLTANAPGGTPGHFWVASRVAGTSFSVVGTAGDTSTLAFELKEPA
jgi:hypothetical protein